MSLEKFTGLIPILADYKATDGNYPDVIEKLQFKRNVPGNNPNPNLHLHLTSSGMWFIIAMDIHITGRAS